MGLFGSLNESDDNKKAVMVLGLIIVTVVILALVTYLFFYNDSQAYNNDDIDAINVPKVQTTQELAESQTIEPAESQGANIEQILPDSAMEALPATASASSVSSLKYTIKPNDMDIFSCVNMRNGKWAMPKQCSSEIVNAVQRLIDNNTELIALEVSGIVDNNPYAGPSAELKQEGLASFRAREAIVTIMRSFSNVAAFEGPSMQMPDKRGFQVKAYYLQK